MTEAITQDEAKELVDEGRVAYLVVGDLKPKPVLGHVDPDEHEVILEINTFRVE